MSGSVTIKATAAEQEISGFDTAVTYRRLRQHLPDDALMMQLQLSLSPLPVRLVKDRQHGSHIATTLAALTGATGCLPPCYEETALAQTLNRNDSYAAFIALFQRHLADLLVEASAKYSAHRQSRRTQPAQNPFLNTILALAGCEHSDEKNEQQLFAMQYAALFADDRRNAESLKAMLADIFGIPIEIAEFQPRWQLVPEDERSFLNGHSRLGADSCIGASARNAAAYFRVSLGPLDYSQFRRFLPDQPEAQQLADLTRFYCGFGLSFDVQLVLEKTAVLPACLSADCRLGYDIWLGATDTHQWHRSDAVFDERTISTNKSRDTNDAS